MSARLALADLGLPPGTLDGFTPEQIADVVRAAEDAARARIATIRSVANVNRQQAALAWAILQQLAAHPTLSSRDELAAAAGITARELDRGLTSASGLSIVALELIANALGLLPSDLVRRAEELAQSHSTAVAR